VLRKGRAGRGREKRESLTAAYPLPMDLHSAPWEKNTFKIEKTLGRMDDIRNDQNPKAQLGESLGKERREERLNSSPRRKRESGRKPTSDSLRERRKKQVFVGGGSPPETWKRGKVSLTRGAALEKKVGVSHPTSCGSLDRELSKCHSIIRAFHHDVGECSTALGERSDPKDSKGLNSTKNRRS